MSDSSIIKQSIDLVYEKLGNDVDIYGVGFSLGANHLLRYLGVNDSQQDIKAVISVSNPFDCMATCVRLKSAFFGIYDRSILGALSKHFFE